MQPRKPLRPISLLKLAAGKVSLGDSILDSFLRGGLACGSITEVTGEPAVAKTQIALQSLLTVQIPCEYGGMQGSALYIYTEADEPPLKRLQSMISHRYAGLPDVSLDHIYLQRGVHTPYALHQCLLSAQQVIASSQAGGGHRRVRLIVIDSIAHIFRDLPDNPGVEDLRTRTEQLFAVSALLKKYAQQYQLAVLITNQVMDDINAPVAVLQGLPGKTAAGQGRGLISSGRKVLPSLGLAWAHCVNTRLFAARHEVGSSTFRTLQVVFSPYLPPSHCFFEVRMEGVVGMAEKAAQHQMDCAAEAAHKVWQQQQQVQDPTWPYGVDDTLLQQSKSANTRKSSASFHEAQRYPQHRMQEQHHDSVSDGRSCLHHQQNNQLQPQDRHPEVQQRHLQSELQWQAFLVQPPHR